MQLYSPSKRLNLEQVDTTGALIAWRVDTTGRRLRQLAGAAPDPPSGIWWLLVYAEPSITPTVCRDRRDALARLTRTAMSYLDINPRPNRKRR